MGVGSPPQIITLREQIEQTAHHLDRLAQRLERLDRELANLSQAISEHVSKQLEIRTPRRST